MSCDLEIELQDWSKIINCIPWTLDPHLLGFYSMNQWNHPNFGLLFNFDENQNYGSAESPTLPATMVRVTVGIPTMDHDNAPIIRAI